MRTHEFLEPALIRAKMLHSCSKHPSLLFLISRTTHSRLSLKLKHVKASLPLAVNASLQTNLFSKQQRKEMTCR